MLLGRWIFLVTSIFLYACESWTLTAELQRRIQAMEMMCYCKILTIVQRRKLQWYGHVSLSSILAKTILQGTVKGGRRQDRQRERWEDSIRECTGLEFAKSQRAVENRGKWRNLVVKSSVVLHRSSRLRDSLDDDDGRNDVPSHKMFHLPNVRIKAHP